MREDLHNKQMTLPLDRRTLTLIFIVCASFARVVCAGPLLTIYQRITITPEPVGSGARALGQSAFLAVADDATAASWNPAGLINLETPETSFVGVWKTITKDHSPADDSVSNYQDHWSKAQINFMNNAQPTEIANTDKVISVNYHQVYNFRTEFVDWFPIPKTDNVWQKEKGKSDGAICAYSMAGGLSMPSYPEIAIGASFNWYSQSLFNDYTWQRKSTGSLWSVPPPPASPDPMPLFSDTTETFDDIRGHNFTFGLL